MAGPASRSQLVMLKLCRDAIHATASISDHRMDALDSAMRTLHVLLQLPQAVSQACISNLLHQ